MPPKASTQEGILLNYINEQNRPVNVQLVADALQVHGIKKTTVQKVLDTLSDNGTISSKDYGKQKVYLAKQDQFIVPSGEELEQMTRENDDMHHELVARKARIREHETELRCVGSHLTDDQIAERVKQLTDEVKDMDSRLSKLQEGAVLIAPEERKRAEESYFLNLDMWKKRKRIFKELWDMIAEAMPMSISKFKEELGIETDEDAGVKLEDYSIVAAKKQRRS